MRTPALVLSGYLAGIQLDGIGTTDVLELQSRVSVTAPAFDIHAAQTLDVAVDGSAFRDVAAGGSIALGSFRVIGEGHILEVASGETGAAGFVGLAARRGRDVLVVGAGGVWAAAARHELAVRLSRERITSRLDASATVIVTGTQVSAGATLTMRATRRAHVTLDTLAGPRSSALLSDGQTLESLSGTQHELVRIVTSVDLGATGTVFAGVQARRDTDVAGGDHVVTAVIAGTSSSF